jgi:hypothetical protein
MRDLADGKRAMRSAGWGKVMFVSESEVVTKQHFMVFLDGSKQTLY